MADTSVQTSQVTLARLQELATWAGVSINQVLDQAVNDQYDRKFWDAVNAGYAALRADPAAWSVFETERKLWNNTLMDGLDPSERWSEDGNALPQIEQQRAS